MALSVDYATKIITVPQADLTPVAGTLYKMDTENYFRQGLMALFADEDHIWMKIPYTHETQSVIVGVLYARKIKIINGYSIQFTPDAQWTVILEGSNNDIFDVESGILVQNQVQVIPNNSAGLIVSIQGSGLSPEQDTKLSDIDTKTDDLVEDGADHLTTKKFIALK
jgi:hypothetical protein